jgi:hypothetical protein
MVGSEEDVVWVAVWVGAVVGVGVGVEVVAEVHPDIATDSNNSADTAKAVPLPIFLYCDDGI